ARGNLKPFAEAMAKDFSWTIAGTSTWGRTWRGKEAVLNELMTPLFARFSDIYTCEARRMIAEGDFVVVEAQGKVTTKSGKAYNNSYCYVCRLLEGQLVELTEYMDTEMAAAVLGPP
ncbi:MAG: nuclear transport factor 2 family protein, partial [Steroidobacteraceae bacterium]